MKVFSQKPILKPKMTDFYAPNGAQIDFRFKFIIHQLLESLQAGTAFQDFIPHCIAAVSLTRRREYSFENFTLKNAKPVHPHHNYHFENQFSKNHQIRILC